MWVKSVSALATRSLHSFFEACGKSLSVFGKSRTIGIALVVLVWAVAAVQWPLRDLVVPWDSKNQFYAFFRFLAAALESGASPFWNPFHYGGHPSIADPQSLIFSPLFVLWAFIDPKPTMFAFDMIVYAHLLVGGVALAIYGSRHGWPMAAYVLAAIIFMFGGPVSSRLNHVGIITAYGLFPVALLSMEIMLDRRSLVAAIGFGFSCALIILGRSQVPLLLAMTLAILFVSNLISAPNVFRFIVNRFPVIALSGVVILTLIVAPMLLSLQFADVSNRPEVNLDLALRSSLYPANFATFFAPNVFGSLETLSNGNWGPGYFTRPDVDSTDRAFNYLFAGSLPALLLVWHGLVGGRAFARGNRVFFAIMFVATLYALGRYTPVFPFAFEHLPFIKFFRRPVDGTFIIVPALAILIGRLVADYINDGSVKVRFSAVSLGAAATVGLLGWAIAFSSRSAEGWNAAYQILKVIPVYIALVYALLVAVSKRSRQVVIALAVVFTVGEMIARNVATPINAEPRDVYAVLESPQGDAATVVDVIRGDMSSRGDGADRPRVEILGLSGPWQNASMVLGLEATNGYNPLRIGAYDRLISPGESTFNQTQRQFPGSFAGYGCTLSKKLGLQYVVLDRPIEQLKQMKKMATAEPILSGPKIWIYRLANVAPRVTFNSRILIADAEKFISAGEFPDQQSNGEVLVDSDDELSQNYRAASYSAAPAKVSISRWRLDRIEVDVESPAPGILTLHDPWYPGWEVEVDHVEREVLRTDILFRGVEVPAGKHKVVFAYRPLSLKNLRSIVDGLIEDRE